MRMFLLLGSALALMSCNEPQVPDCEQIMQEIYACMDRIAEQPIMGDIESCIPMQEAEQIEGTWATDFEFNEFYENRRLSFEDARSPGEETTELWTADGEGDIQTPEMASVFWVRFVGRRPVCDASENEHFIWMDRLLEYEEIEERPSAWFSR